MAKHTDLTFITNEAGQSSLSERLSALLGQTSNFDCLVGYFFISGFYRIYPSLENVEKIRILVGLKTDRAVHEQIERAKEQQEIDLKSHATIQKEVSSDVLKELEVSPDKYDIETGVLKFVEWIKSKKLEIKAHRDGRLHAKVYICTLQKESLDKGRVITGSSNLTQAGLQDNLEFNVELKNPFDYNFALDKFNELWSTAVDVSESYVETVTQKSPFAEFTPYELYLKFLYEYFRTDLNRSAELEDAYVPDGFKNLKYQSEAVLNARRVLEEYNGVFLADVVGLGKTYMAALLAQQLEGRHLVIAPPQLIDEDKPGSWPNVFRDFGIRHTKVLSVGKIDDFLKNNPTAKYDNVFIDESHRFRNEATQGYETLATICQGKRVILVSATPLNNSPLDILSQVKLFQAGRASTIPNLRDLEAFFSNLQARLAGLDRQKDRETYFSIVQDNAKQTRERVLKYLMVRRTRTEIQRYYGKDMQKQGFKFPEVKDPIALFYQLNQQENEIFNETLRLLISQFHYARYMPLVYYIGEAKITEQEKQGQRNIAVFMKVLMGKRLESSFHAFRQTLRRFINSYDRVIKEFENGNVYISKKHTDKVFELLEEDNQEGIERLLEEDKATRYDASDFLDSFITHLKEDHETLQQVEKMWNTIDRDPKWLAFKEDLQTKPHLKKDKLIIFSESYETAAYLTERIRKEVEPKTLLFSGQSGRPERREVTANFDANAAKSANKYRILVTTEVLSEGVNLHRSNIVINYDIPWNPTRMIQRVGRVNRVDTKFKDIHTFTFFPSIEVNDAIKLREAAEAKIHAFIEMLGADARLLTEDEEPKSFDLFGKLTSKETITGEDEEEESELEYLTEIRNIRDNQKDLYNRIEHMPKKARSTRTLPATTQLSVRQFPSLLTYFRQGQLDKFYLAGDTSDNPEELDFLSAVKVLKPDDIQEKRKPILSDFYTLLDRNRSAFGKAVSPIDDDITPVRGRASDTYILRRLRAKEIQHCQDFTEDDRAFIQQVIQLITDGRLLKRRAAQIKKAIETEAEPLKVVGILRRDIPSQFFQRADASLESSDLKPQEVILSSLISSDIEV